MFPYFFRIQSLVALVFAALIANPLMAQEDAAPRSGKIVSFAAADNVNELYVAIMGEVDTPGTYRLDSSSLSMHRVIRCAHGFTADASMAIRVIRPGRIRQTEIFSERSDSPLMPGDLLIVESRRLKMRTGKIADADSRDSETVRAGYEEGTIRAGVQIALLNVLDYPLVLRLRPEQANAAYLVQALGQPLSLLASTRVITPDVPGRQSSDEAKRASRMDDGSVIVFEAGKVNRNRLPVTLPKPTDGEIAMVSQSELLGLRYRQSPDVRNLGQHPFWSNANPFDATPRVTHHGSRGMSQPASGVPQVLAAEREAETVADEPNIATHDASASPRDESMAERDLSDPDSQATFVAIETTADKEDPVESESQRFSVFQLRITVLICGTLAMIGIALLLFRFTAKNEPDKHPVSQAIHVEEMQVTSVSFPGIAGSGKSLLGRLIDEQSLTHPQQMTPVNEAETQGRATESPTIEFPRRTLRLAENSHPFASTNRVVQVPVEVQDSGSEMREPITIPIRAKADFGLRRPSENDAAAHDEPDKVPPQAPEPESTLTPLAKALRQIEQRRSA